MTVYSLENLIECLQHKHENKKEHLLNGKFEISHINIGLLLLEIRYF